MELDPEKERALKRGLRTKKVNTKDRESLGAEEIYQGRRSLGGYLARVSTVINQFKPVLLRLVNVRKFVKL